MVFGAIAFIQFEPPARWYRRADSTCWWENLYFDFIVNKWRFNASQVLKLLVSCKVLSGCVIVAIQLDS